MLKNLCAKIDKDFDKLEIDKLNIYAVEVRYPEDFFMPSVEESKECYQLAIEVKRFVFDKLGIEEGEIKKW